MFQQVHWHHTSSRRRSYVEILTLCSLVGQFCAWDDLQTDGWKSSNERYNMFADVPIRTVATTTTEAYSSPPAIRELRLLGDQQMVWAMVSSPTQASLNCPHLTGSVYGLDSNCPKYNAAEACQSDCLDTVYGCNGINYNPYDKSCCFKRCEDPFNPIFSTVMSGHFVYIYRAESWTTMTATTTTTKTTTTTTTTTTTNSCPRHISVQGVVGQAAVWANGIFTKLSLSPTSEQDGRPIYKQSNGVYLYYWAAWEAWGIGYDYMAQTDVSSHAWEKAKCPSEASMWLEWDNDQWKILPEVSIEEAPYVISCGSKLAVGCSDCSQEASGCKGDCTWRAGSCQKAICRDVRNQSSLQVCQREFNDSNCDPELNHWFAVKQCSGTCVNWYPQYDYKCESSMHGWSSSASWVDDSATQSNVYHSSIRQSGTTSFLPSRTMDDNASTFALFDGRSGFMLLDLGIACSVKQLRIRSCNTSSSAKTIILQSSLENPETNGGNWEFLINMTMESDEWQESDHFVTFARFFRLSWLDNHNSVEDETRICDAKLLLQGRARYVQIRDYSGKYVHMDGMGEVRSQYGPYPLDNRTSVFEFVYLGRCQSELGTYSSLSRYTHPEADCFAIKNVFLQKYIRLVSSAWVTSNSDSDFGTDNEFQLIGNHSNAGFWSPSESSFISAGISSPYLNASCWSGSVGARETFVLEDVEALLEGTFTIQSKGTGQYLLSQANIIDLGVDAGTDATNWVITPVLGEDSVATITHATNMLYLHTTAPNRSSPGCVGLEDADDKEDGSDSQDWILSPIGFDTYTIRSKLYRQYLEAGHYPSCGAKLKTRPSFGGARAEWIIVRRRKFTTTTEHITTTTTATTTSFLGTDVVDFMLGISVSNVEQFVQEPNLTQVLRRPLASLSNVPEDWIFNISITQVPLERRLSSRSDSSAMESGDPNAVVSWSIRISPDGNITATVLVDEFDQQSIASATSAIQAAISSGVLGIDYDVKVTWKYYVASEKQSDPIEQRSDEITNNDGTHLSVWTLLLPPILALLCLSIAFLAARKLGMLKLFGAIRRSTKRFSEAAGPLSQHSYVDLLFPPETITEQDGKQIRQLVRAMLRPNEHNEASVYLTYALGTREQDAVDCGPGMYYAAAVVRMLYDNDIKCFCNMMLPDKACAGVMAGMLGSRFGSCKALLVLQTQGLYECSQTLIDIFTAQTENIDLIPLRFESELPSKEQEWPHVKREDVNTVMMLSAVQSKFCRYNSIPSPPYTVIDQPSVLEDLLIDLRMKIHVRPVSIFASMGSAESRKQSNSGLDEKMDPLDEKMDPVVVGSEAMLAAESLGSTSGGAIECSPKLESKRGLTISRNAGTIAPTLTRSASMKSMKRQKWNTKKTCMARKSVNPNVVGLKDCEFTLERASTLPELQTCSSVQALKKFATQSDGTNYSAPSVTRTESLKCQTANQQKTFKPTRRTIRHDPACDVDPLRKFTSGELLPALSVNHMCSSKCDDGEADDTALAAAIDASISEKSEKKPRLNRQKTQKQLRTARTEVAQPMLCRTVSLKSVKTKGDSAERRAKGA